MPEPWSADFTYAYYRNLLTAAKRSFEPILYHEYPARKETGRPLLLMRHDVDASLERALAIARIEAELGVRATYMVIPNSTVYALDDPASRDALRELQRLGHAVGLHFDPPPAARAGASVAQLEREIDAACGVLGAAAGCDVQSISFHRPSPQFLRGPLFVGGRVNAYAAELMQWYLSDSKGRWREGEPLPRVLGAEKPVLQLLTHPIWWGEKHLPAAERMREFFGSMTRGLGAADAQRFSDALHEALPEDWPPA